MDSSTAARSSTRAIRSACAGPSRCASILANLTEFDLVNSLHLHGDFFRYQPTGTGDHWEYTDTVVQCQGQRGVLEIEFAKSGTFMFHAHQSEFAELGWMGFFEVEG